MSRLASYVLLSAKRMRVPFKIKTVSGPGGVKALDPPSPSSTNPLTLEFELRCTFFAEESLSGTKEA